MKQILIAVIFLFAASFTKAQKGIYKEYDVCIDSAVYKGKKNHGKYYCTATMQIREYKNGKKDTGLYFFSSTIVSVDDEYEKYLKLSERGKYIVDSLKEDGIPQLQDSYLTYEPIYMKEGQKVENFWSIYGEDVVIYTYKIWRNKKSSGIELLKTSNPIK